MEKRRVYAFDFDGTLTKNDTLLLFVAFVRGRMMLLLGLLLFTPLLLLMKLRLVSNGRIKQRFFSFYFKGMSEKEFNNYCVSFATVYKSIVREKGMIKIKEALAKKCEVLIVSASIRNWVEPFFMDVPVIIVATEIEIEDGKVTGKFRTNNCYGKEKVRRILKFFPNRDEYELTAYGDSSGDRKMLTFADEAFYKSFR